MTPGEPTRQSTRRSKVNHGRLAKQTGKFLNAGSARPVANALAPFYMMQPPLVGVVPATGLLSSVAADDDDRAASEAVYFAIIILTNSS